MKATCNRADFLSAFQLVAGVVPSRSPKPVLLNVKLAASTDGAVLMATDLEVGIRASVTGIEVHQAGEVLLPTARVLAILRESTDPIVEIETDGSQTSIIGQRSRYKLSSQDNRDFPDQPGFAEDKYHCVASSLLRTMIRRTVFAADAESTRYALNGILFEAVGDKLKLVATDGRRLAVMGGTASAVGGHTTTLATPAVPTKAVNLLDRTLPDDDDVDVHVAILPNKAVFRTCSVVIATRLVEGRFPRYSEVIPSRSETTLSLNVKDLLQATRQAAIVTSEESRGVDYTFADGKLTLASKAAEVGQSDIELPIAYDAKSLTITFDPRYLVDMLRVLDGESTVTLDLIDHQSAAVFKTDDGMVYIVMPLTRDK